MKPKELSELTGVKERTIRFYEEQGLLQPDIERKNGRNFREYSVEDAERLRQIVTLRKGQLTLEEIREMLEQEDGFEQIYPAYLSRIRKEAESVGKLKELVERIDPKEISVSEFIAFLEGSDAEMTLPAMDISLNFGRFDDETPEEKQQALEAYYARHNFRELLFSYLAMRRRNLMKLFQKSDKKKKKDNQRAYQQGVYSGTAVEHTYVKGGVRDGGLGNAQKLAVLQMLREDKTK